MFSDGKPFLNKASPSDECSVDPILLGDLLDRHTLNGVAESRIVRLEEQLLNEGAVLPVSQ